MNVQETKPLDQMILDDTKSAVICGIKQEASEEQMPLDDTEEADDSGLAQQQSKEVTALDAERARHMRCHQTRNFAWLKI